MIILDDFFKKIEYKKIILAISGGVDSIVMLDLFLKNKDNYNLDLEICHVNHSTREGESDLDEKFVRDLAKKNNLVYHTKKVDMYGYAEKESISPEEAGRILRKEFFSEIIGDNDYLLALAHNKDDQVETILMRILRGTGIEGLKGMSQFDGNIVRPLIDITKEEIITYQKENKLKFVQDKTNYQNIYNRNKIRNELIPLIKSEYNPNIYDAIINLSNIARFEREFIEQVVGLKIENIIKYRDYNKTIFVRSELINQSKFMLNEIIRNEIDRISSNYNFTKKQYDEIIKTINGKSGAIKILNSIVFYNSFDEFVIRLEVNNQLENHRILDDMSSLEVNKYLIENKSGFPITIRKRENGDKLKIKSKEKQLKALLIDNKVDLYDRELIPIIEIDKEIIGVGDIYINKEYEINVTKIKEKE